MTSIAVIHFGILNPSLVATRSRSGKPKGTPIGSSFRPVSSANVSNIKNPKQTTPAQRVQLDFIQSLNRESLENDPHNPGVEGAIESFELAFRMQKDLPKLMDLANGVSPAPPGRELDMLLTSGERISMALLAMAIATLGMEARSFTGSQAGVITDDVHGRARIIDVTPGRISSALLAGSSNKGGSRRWLRWQMQPASPGQLLIATSPNRPRWCARRCSTR